MLEHNGAIVKGEGFLVDDLTNHGIKFIEDNRDEITALQLIFSQPQRQQRLTLEHVRALAGEILRREDSRMAEAV